jgi:integrase/recombinase XerD
MTKEFPKDFAQNYQTHIKFLKLNGLQPKTIESYSCAVRKLGAYFDYQIDALTEQQLTDYFADLLETHSWSTVKHSLWGLRFYYEHVLHQPWVVSNLIKPPTAQKLPDIVTVEQVLQIFAAIRVLSYRVFFIRFTAWV